MIELRGHDIGHWQEQGGALADRAERVGDTLLFYTRDPEPLLGALGANPEQRYWHRPAGLEDVFLRLTGHELRD